MTKTVEKSAMINKGEKVARQSAIVTTILTILKGVAGILSGSVAMTADAVHSFSDIFSSFAVYIGLKLAEKKPSEKFPYGYYKAETFALLIVSLVIILAGIEIFIESINNLFSPIAITSVVFVLIEPINNLFSLTEITSVVFVLSVSTISAIVSYFLARFKENTGKEINSKALISEGKHSMIDVYVSGLVFAGVLFSYLGFPWIEALAGLAISIFIIKIGLWFGKDAILVLMDASLKPELVSKIEETAKNVQGVRGVHDLKVRRAGMFVFGEMHVETAERLPVKKANRISEEVEKKVKENVKEVDSLTIHIEPAKKESFRVAVSIEEDKGFESRPKMHFGNSPYFIIIDIDKGKIKHWVTKRNPAFEMDRKRGVTTANFLVKQKIDILLTKELGEAPFHILRDNFIDIFKLPSVELKEALDLMIENKLDTITTPDKKFEP